MANRTQSLPFYFWSCCVNILKVNQKSLKTFKPEVEYMVRNWYWIQIYKVLSLARIPSWANIKMPQEIKMVFRGQFKVIKSKITSFTDCSCALVCDLWPQNGGQIQIILEILLQWVKSGIILWIRGTAYNT